MQIHRNGFTINFETIGPATGVPLVLVSGMGEQIGSVEFPDEQAKLFADQGYRVVRIDNRDCGLSVPDEELPARDFMAIAAESLAGGKPAVDYTLHDNVDDIFAVLDSLGIAQSHLCGASLGGYIVRWCALKHPDRVLSLTIIMSGSGAALGEDGPQVTPTALASMSARGGQDERAVAIEAYVEKWRSFWGHAYEFPEDWIRKCAVYSHDRSYRPEAYVRQLIAVFFSPGLWKAQTKIGCPVLIIHGDSDPIFSTDHPRALHEVLPQSRLIILPGVGHAMPKETWETTINMHRAGRQRDARMSAAV